MTHPDDDLLLKCILETLDTEEEKVIRNHLATCEICTQKVSKIRSDVVKLREFNPDVETEFIPLPAEDKSSWFKAAAILIIGFIAGYFTSNYLHPEPVQVVEQLLISTSPKVTVTSFNPVAVVDAFTNMY
jgi:hypothetical protein